MRIFLNTSGSVRLYAEEDLPVLDGLAVVDEHLFDHPGRLRLDLVHQLHGLDDAEDGAGLHALADAHERRRVRRRRGVEGADDGGYDVDEALSRRRGGGLWRLL